MLLAESIREGVLDKVTPEDFTPKEEKSIIQHVEEWWDSRPSL